MDLSLNCNFYWRSAQFRFFLTYSGLSLKSFGSVANLFLTCRIRDSFWSVGNHFLTRFPSSFDLSPIFFWSFISLLWSVTNHLLTGRQSISDPSPVFFWSVASQFLTHLHLIVTNQLLIHCQPSSDLSPIFFYLSPIIIWAVANLLSCYHHQWSFCTSSSTNP